MTVRESLERASASLSDKETETPRLDASLLLSHSMGLTREQLYMDLDRIVPPGILNNFNSILERRVSGEPVAWILGTKEFWGLPFAVGPGVLCPRADSETIVEAALRRMDEISAVRGSGFLHDCCCGPGTLALALAAERPDWVVSASDISRTAALYFHKNNKALADGRVLYKPADLLKDIDGPFDIIVSNPPYLTTQETTEKTALGWKEPTAALDGGANGLDIIERLIPQAAWKLRSPGSLFIEADSRQMPNIKDMLVDGGFCAIKIYTDLSGQERVISGQTTESL